MEATLLVEILTEELPPKSLRMLGEHFASTLAADLHKSGFVVEPGAKAFATPRRLAVRVAKVGERSPDLAPAEASAADDDAMDSLPTGFS